MEAGQKVLLVDLGTGFHKTVRYGFDRYFGPVDLGIHLSVERQSLNFGVGVFAGSVFPGSNRLVVTGFSPCWQGYYISSMGGAGLVFENLGINMLSLTGKAPTPSILYLNRDHGEEVQVEVVPVDAHEIWGQGEGGVYAMAQYTHSAFAGRYRNDPRILATGPAALASDMGAIMSSPIKNGIISPVDTWAGRGGFGSAMAQRHGIVAVIYGGTVVDDDFRDRSVADGWFRERYNVHMAQKDAEATRKYRHDEASGTGGTFGVNYANMGGRILAFNYRTIHWSEEERLDLHQRFVVQHYLKQFNDETIVGRQQATCGEPCGAVCKKMNGSFKKDYEPYQTMGPLCGVFDQRAAEKLNHHCDSMGFDAISAGGVLAWLMDLLDRGRLTRDQLAVTRLPRWQVAEFDLVADSLHNAELGCELLDSIVGRKGCLDLREGVRKWSRTQSKLLGMQLYDIFLYSAFGRRGWMVPNQYWTTGVLAPMAIMGKYYMVYGNDFLPPRELGRACAERMVRELALDNLGTCRFHRGWAEELLPEVMGNIFGCRDEFLHGIRVLAGRLNSYNCPVFLESQAGIDFWHTFLRRKHAVEGCDDPALIHWLERFDADGREAARDFWYEVLKGIDESLVDLY